MRKLRCKPSMVIRSGFLSSVCESHGRTRSVIAYLLRNSVRVRCILPRRDDLRLIGSGAQETLRNEVGWEVRAVEQVHDDFIADLRVCKGQPVSPGDRPVKLQ